MPSDTQPLIASDLPPSWARALGDPAAFAREQNRLAQVWTMLGLTTDIPKDNDWIRASIGDRSVFVQRFGDAIRGFENRCAHRQFPLRTRDRGNGVIRCAFHHWQYDRQGRAIGIPRCPELFGVTPRELGASLCQIEIATCGTVIFGRFAMPGDTMTLEDYLGDGFHILAAITNLDKAPRHLVRPVKSNWQLPYQISMDDYHLVAVHPGSFGKNGYLTTGVTYFRYGANLDHSAYFPGAEDDAFGRMVQECRDGTYVPHRFRIFHFFPNFSAVMLKVPGFYFVMLIQCRGTAMDKTDVNVWYFPSPFQKDQKSRSQKAYEDAVAFFMPHYFTRVLGEDNRINEQHQAIARQIDSRQILGRHEWRVGWFMEAYERAMGREETPVASLWKAPAV